MACLKAICGWQMRRASRSWSKRDPAYLNGFLHGFRDHCRFVRWELGGAQILFSGLLSLGILALVGIPRRPSTRLFAGAMAGSGDRWNLLGLRVSEPSLGIRILLECVAAAW